MCVCVFVCMCVRVFVCDLSDSFALVHIESGLSSAAWAVPNFFGILYTSPQGACLSSELVSLPYLTKPDQVHARTP